MIGVKFNHPVRPFGAGDTALLPEDVAQAAVDCGDAELYEFPDGPHAHETGHQEMVTRPFSPPARGKLSLKKK